jgi:hypothetical protein
VGQRAEEVHYRRSGVRRTYRHLQLHRASDLADLARCGRCQRGIRNKELRQLGTEFAEWTEDMPLFPGEPVLVDEPCAAPWPVYYRYRVEGPQRWLPDVSWLNVGATGTEEDSVEAAVARAGLGAASLAVVNDFLSMVGVEAPQPWRREVDASIEWHRPTLPLEERERLRAQREVQERRQVVAREQLAALAMEDPATMAANSRAMGLLVEVLGTERADQMAEHGYLDVESTLWRDAAYRIRPWRRIGVLRRGPDGEWMELNRSWCVHPDELYPMADEVVALYLALRFDEHATLRKANLHREAA